MLTISLQCAHHKYTYYAPVSTVECSSVWSNITNSTSVKTWEHVGLVLQSHFNELCQSIQSITLTAIHKIRKATWALCCSHWSFIYTALSLRVFLSYQMRYWYKTHITFVCVYHLLDSNENLPKYDRNTFLPWVIVSIYSLNKVNFIFNFKSTFQY